MEKFRERRVKIRPAVLRMLEEAQEAADSIDTSVPPEQKITELFDDDEAISSIARCHGLDRRFFEALDEVIRQ